MDILPLLTYRDLTAALEQLETAFGLEPIVWARDDDGAVIQGAVAHGNGLVPMERERPADLHGEHAGNGWIYVRIDDPVEHIARARAAGAEILDDLHDIPGEGGHHGYSARDREGNLWTFGSAPIER